MTLLAIRTRSRLATIAAIILMATLPFVALRTHAGSAVGAIGPLVMFVGAPAGGTWTSRNVPGAHEPRCGHSPLTGPVNQPRSGRSPLADRGAYVSSRADPG